MTPLARDVEIAAEKRRALLQRSRDDPAYPKNRDKIAARIGKEMDLRLTPLGFQREGRVWKRKGWWYDLSVDLQRSSYGHDAWINLTATPRLGGRAVQRRLGDFYPNPPYAAEPGRLTYQALIEDPSLLDTPMQVLTDHALPWLIGMGQLRLRR